ncbi:MAG TPA: hypothetical protein PK954_15970, partial [Anaerolineales bacterium]|nr:hypothetical protein [Anaerolineales bacterium]
FAAGVAQAVSSKLAIATDESSARAILLMTLLLIEQLKRVAVGGYDRLKMASCTLHDWVSVKKVACKLFQSG